MISYPIIFISYILTSVLLHGNNWLSGRLPVYVHVCVGSRIFKIIVILITVVDLYVVACL